MEIYYSLIKYHKLKESGAEGKEGIGDWDFRI